MFDQFFYILANILYSRLHAVHSSLIGSEQICSLKVRAILDNIHLVRLIIENLDLSNRVGNRLQEAVLVVAVLGPYFRTWNPTSLCVSPVCWWKGTDYNSSFSYCFAPLVKVVHFRVCRTFLRWNLSFSRVNSVLGAPTSTRYSAYTGNISALVSNIARIAETYKVARGYETVT